MELPSIDEIFKEMRFAATKPVTSSVDSGRKNNSDMDSNSVMVRTELNKDRPESIVLKEKSLAIQKPAKFNKIAMFDFSEAKRPISVSSLVKCNSEQQFMTEQSSVGDIHQDTRDHYLRSNDKILMGQHSELFSRAGTTGQTGSSRPVPAGSAAGGHREERHD